jgi:RecA-family ATPase
MQQENGVYTAKELCEKFIPPMKWIAKDFLAEGTTLLSARPKAGKSLLALQLAIAVAKGEPFLGRYQTVIRK